MSDHGHLTLPPLGTPKYQSERHVVAVLVVSVLVGKRVILDFHVQRFEIGRDTGLAIDLPAPRADDHIGVLDAGILKRGDGVLVQQSTLVVRQQPNLRRADFEADLHLDEMVDLLIRVARRQRFDVPDVVGELLGQRIILNDNTERTVTLTAKLIVFAGEVLEDNAGIIDCEFIVAFHRSFSFTLS